MVFNLIFFCFPPFFISVFLQFRGKTNTFFVDVWIQRSVELQYVFQKEEKEVRIEKKNITKANITTNSQYFIWYQFWG